MAIEHFMVVPPWSSTLFLTEPELVELVSQLCELRQRTPSNGVYQWIVDGNLLCPAHWLVTFPCSVRSPLRG